MFLLARFELLAHTNTLFISLHKYALYPVTNTRFISLQQSTWEFNRSTYYFKCVTYISKLVCQFEGWVLKAEVFTGTCGQDETKVYMDDVALGV